MLWPGFIHVTFYPFICLMKVIPGIINETRNCMTKGYTK